MSIYAYALANATANAYALASFYGSAIYQDVNLTDGYQAYMTPCRTTAIMDFGAFATADGVTKATAIAYNYDGIDQYAEDGVQSTATLNNSDVLLIGAYASAYAHNGNAFASADEEYALYQYVSATAGTSGITVFCSGGDDQHQ